MISIFLKQKMTLIKTAHWSRLLYIHVDYHNIILEQFNLSFVNKEINPFILIHFFERKRENNSNSHDVFKTLLIITRVEQRVNTILLLFKMDFDWLFG